MNIDRAKATGDTAVEDKREIVMLLKWLLKATRAGSGIDRLVLSADEKTVDVVYNSGCSCQVNVECDSGVALIQDVVKSFL